MNVQFAKDLTDRMLRTFIQVFLASMGASSIWNISADKTGVIAALSAVASGLMSALAGVVSKGETASFVGAVTKRIDPKNPLEKQLVVIGGDAMVEIIKAAQEQFQGKPSVDPPALPMATPEPLPDLLAPDPTQ